MKYFISSLIIFVMILSVSFGQESKMKKQKVQKNPEQVESVPQEWKEQEKGIKNPELRKLLDELKNNFISERDMLKKEYKQKLDNLRKQFSQKRQYIIEDYKTNNKTEIKPRKKNKYNTFKKKKEERSEYKRKPKDKPAEIGSTKATPDKVKPKKVEETEKSDKKPSDSTDKK